MEEMRQLRKQWYVVSTKARNEEAARLHLNRTGIQVFYPKLLLPVLNKSGRKMVSLFPNYIFVHIDTSSSEYSRVLWCRGVNRFVSFGGMPAALENNVVDFIREQADQNGLIVARSNLHVGDEVQIAKGPFKGLVVIIQQPPDTKSRVKVLMAILNQRIQVEVPTGHIEIGWVAPCAPL